MEEGVLPIVSTSVSHDEFPYKSHTRLVVTTRLEGNKLKLFSEDSMQLVLSRSSGAGRCRTQTRIFTIYKLCNPTNLSPRGQFPAPHKPLQLWVRSPESVSVGMH
jgi:hypothetical protein